MNLRHISVVLEDFRFRFWAIISAMKKKDWIGRSTCRTVPIALRSYAGFPLSFSCSSISEVLEWPNWHKFNVNVAQHIFDDHFRMPHGIPFPRLGADPGFFVPRRHECALSLGNIYGNKGAVVRVQSQHGLWLHISGRGCRQLQFSGSSIARCKQTRK